MNQVELRTRLLDGNEFVEPDLEQANDDQIWNFIQNGSLNNEPVRDDSELAARISNRNVKLTAALTCLGIVAGLLFIIGDKMRSLL